MSEQFHSCNFCDYTTPTIRGFVTHMSMKHKDSIQEDNSTIIGRGEKVLVQILKEKLPDAKIYTQVHLKYLVPSEEVKLFSERQIKETVDVLLIYQKHWMVFRVQDSRHQKGIVLMQADQIQKRLIQKYHGEKSVIELRESECKILFSNINNWYSQSEVGVQCELEGLRL